MSKYRNIKTVVDGIKFDSRKEANRYIELKVAEHGDIIKDLELQPRFLLQGAFRHNGKAVRAIEYVADFRYTDVKTGADIIEDVKGMETREFRIKKKLFLKRFPDLDLRIVK